MSKESSQSDRSDGRFVIYELTKGVHKTCLECIRKRYDSLVDKSLF